ncbi:MAG TPA: ABC transporter substrate-binding protein, partial [Thermomicrobiales bacterium]|nr:ABC transporter substrate-binding protein [Thermomicrobiales bacterium]
MEARYQLTDDEQHGRIEAVLGGTVSRRRLLQRAALLGLSAPVIGGLLAACGGDDDDDDTPTNTTTSGGDATAPAGETPSGDDASPTSAGSPGTSGSPTGTTPEAQATTGTTGQPPGEGVAGGTLTFGLLRDPIAFDPHIAYGASSSSLQGNVYDTLVEYDVDSALIGALAESWEVSDDGLEYVMSLRQGVTFHDGATF